MEDNLGDVVLVKDAFEREGRKCDFTIAKDGEIAAKIFREGCDFDLVFLDLNIPKIDGLELLKSICSDSRYESLPIFVFTSSMAKSDIDACRNSCALHYYLKPKLLNDYRLLAKQILEKFLDFNAKTDNLNGHWE